jgi:hypothetical protein
MSERAHRKIGSIVVGGLLAVSAAMAEPNFEAEAFKTFESACLHDAEQFDKAQALAAERAMAVPPERIRDVLVKRGQGAAWLARAQPFIALHANLTAGCGVMLKPADEAKLMVLVDNLEGARRVSGDRFETSWSRWYLVERQGLRGVMLAGLFAGSDSPSAHLRYLPSDIVLKDDTARDFLLADTARLETLRRALRGL